MNHSNIIRTAVLFTSCVAAASCSFLEQQDGPRFGYFGHNGTYLTEYAVSEIDVDEAKTLVGGKSQQARALPRAAANISEESEDVKSILGRYASLTTKVYYYVAGNDEQQVREELFQGTDLQAILHANSYSPFGQMNVKHLHLNETLLDELEAENAAFRASEESLISPYQNLYTYHKDSYGALVVQSHYFAELPSSVNGGIGATFRQDCEMQFDGEGKIRMWQSSLGLYTSTPTGTSSEGYIFSSTFEWTLK